jgi:hypothetical protein
MTSRLVDRCPFLRSRVIAQLVGHCQQMDAADFADVRHEILDLLYRIPEHRPGAPFQEYTFVMGGNGDARGWQLALNGLYHFLGFRSRVADGEVSHQPGLNRARRQKVPPLRICKWKYRNYIFPLATFDVLSRRLRRSGPSSPFILRGDACTQRQKVPHPFHV